MGQKSEPAFVWFSEVGLRRSRYRGIPEPVELQTYQHWLEWSHNIDLIRPPLGVDLGPRRALAWAGLGPWGSFRIGGRASWALAGSLAMAFRPRLGP